MVLRPGPDFSVDFAGTTVQRNVQLRHTVREINPRAVIDVEVSNVKDVHLIDVRKNSRKGRPLAAGAESDTEARWENVIGCLVIVEGQPDLLEIVLALGTPRRFPRTLHSRKQQGHQDGN